MWGLTIIIVAQLAMMIIILLSMTKLFEKVSMITLIRLFYFSFVTGLFGVVIALAQLVFSILDFIF